MSRPTKATLPLGRLSTARAGTRLEALTTAVRDALVRAGLEKDFPYLRADLNAFRHGLVELGRVSPDTAERLAELLRLALASGVSRDSEGAEHAPTAAEEHKGRDLTP